MHAESRSCKDASFFKISFDYTHTVHSAVSYTQKTSLQFTISALVFLSTGQLKSSCVLSGCATNITSFIEPIQQLLRDDKANFPTLLTKMSRNSCFLGPVTFRPAISQTNLKSGLDFVCARPNSVSTIPRRPRAKVSMGLFGLGLPEIAVIACVGIFIFGPQKIADMGKDLGGLAGGVKKATSEFREAMEDSLADADKEIEERKVEKESASNQTVDTTASTPIDSDKELA